MFVLCSVASFKPSSFVSDSAPTAILAPIVSAALPYRPLVTIQLLSLAFYCFVQTFLTLPARRFWLWNWLSLCRLSDDLTQSLPSVLPFGARTAHPFLDPCLPIQATPRSRGPLREERKRVVGGPKCSLLCCRSGQDRGRRAVGELRLSQRRND
jgi:hypothetical protein